jgi:hypothetical protein
MHRRHRRGEVIVDLDAEVTAPEAQSYKPLKVHGVCRHTITWWRRAGHIAPVGKRGRSPLYRWGDLLRAERDTRMSGQSHRSSRCRSCERVSERCAA